MYNSSKNREIIDKVVDKKVVNKKPPNLVRVLRRKTDALCIRLQLRRVDLKDEVKAQRIEIQ